MFTAHGFPLVVFEMSSGRIDHIGIATSNLDSNSHLWKILGFRHNKDEINEEQGVKIRFFESVGDGSKLPKIELLEPINDDSPIHRFISKKGEGIQQLAIEVSDIESMISDLTGNGFTMINETPQKGASGTLIAFIHPKSTGGILIELVEHSDRS